MKKTTSTLLAATILLGGAAFAQTPSTSTSTSRSQFGTGGLPEFLKPYDLNSDGVLSVEEHQAYVKALREAHTNTVGRTNPWDTDGDGVLSEAEKLAARNAIAAKVAEHRSQRFDELDLNKDGFLSPSEVTGIPQISPEQAAMVLKHLDKNGDGKISKEEFLAVFAPVDAAVPPMPPIPTAPPAPTAPGAPVHPFDTNKDGQVSQAEHQAAMTAIDTNGDKHISEEDWRAYVLANPSLFPAPPAPAPAPAPAQ